MLPKFKVWQGLGTTSEQQGTAKGEKKEGNEGEGPKERKEEEDTIACIGQESYVRNERTNGTSEP